MTNSYDRGDLVHLTATFLANGFPTDPSGIVFKTKSPSRVVTSYVYGIAGQLVRDSTGVYHIDLRPTEVGKWQYRWEASGAAESAESGRFYVRRLNISND